MSILQLELMRNFFKSVFPLAQAQEIYLRYFYYLPIIHVLRLNYDLDI